MTLHIHYDHQCPLCEAFYIPYDEDVPCPQCGMLEKERFDYISQATQSILFNKQRYGSYIPPAWYKGSLGDHILYLLFRLFTGYEEQPPSADFNEFASEVLSNMQWGDQQYLCSHVQGIALRVYQDMQAKSAMPTDREKDKLGPEQCK